MKTADKIIYHLMSWVQGNGYDIVIPNFYFGYNEMDLFRLLASGYIIEYEIKISRSDFFNDFKKTDFFDKSKHEKMKDGNCANRFYFVVPNNLITISEIPIHAGLIYFNGNNTPNPTTIGGMFTLIKQAPLLHKNKKSGELFYKSLAQSLSFREMIHRGKAKYWKDKFDFYIKEK